MAAPTTGNVFFLDLTNDLEGSMTISGVGMPVVPPMNNFANWQPLTIPKPATISITFQNSSNPGDFDTMAIMNPVQGGAIMYSAATPAQDPMYAYWAASWFVADIFYVLGVRVCRADAPYLASMLTLMKGAPAATLMNMPFRAMSILTGGFKKKTQIQSNITGVFAQVQLDEAQEINVFPVDATGAVNLIVDGVSVPYDTLPTAYGAADANGVVSMKSVTNGTQAAAFMKSSAFAATSDMPMLTSSGVTMPVTSDITRVVMLNTLMTKVSIKVIAASASNVTTANYAGKDIVYASASEVVTTPETITHDLGSQDVKKFALTQEAGPCNFSVNGVAVKPTTGLGGLAPVTRLSPTGGGDEIYAMPWGRTLYIIVGEKAGRALMRSTDQYKLVQKDEVKWINKKVGGLPRWGWISIGGGGALVLIIVAILLHRHSLMKNRVRTTLPRSAAQRMQRVNRETGAVRSRAMGYSPRRDPNGHSSVYGMDGRA